MRGSSRRRSRSTRRAAVGEPSPRERRAGASGSNGSETSVTRSSTTFSPILLPPPGFEKNERPSSAARALSGAGDELHEIADRGRLEHDGVAARLDRRPDSPTSAPSAPRARRAPRRRSSRSRQCAAPAQPEPVPSAVRTVVGEHRRRLAIVREQALCCSRSRARRRCVSMKPVETRLAAFAGVGDRVHRSRARGRIERCRRVAPADAGRVLSAAPSSGIASGSSGASFATRFGTFDDGLRAPRRRASSSSTLAARFPNVLRTVTRVS